MRQPKTNTNNPVANMKEPESSDLIDLRASL